MVGGPPPPRTHPLTHTRAQVVVEYHPNEVDAFIALADAVEEAFEGIIVDGVEVCAPVLCPPRCRRTRRALLLRARTPTLPPCLPAIPQVEDRPQAFDVKLEDGSLVYSRAGGAVLPPHAAIITQLATSGLPAAATA